MGARTHHRLSKKTGRYVALPDFSLERGALSPHESETALKCLVRLLAREVAAAHVSQLLACSQLPPRENQPN
jgi:hypothetical protein